MVNMKYFRVRCHILSAGGAITGRLTGEPWFFWLTLAKIPGMLSTKLPGNSFLHLPLFGTQFTLFCFGNPRDSIEAVGTRSFRSSSEDMTRFLEALPTSEDAANGLFHRTTAVDLATSNMGLW
jgi:hypothetical protein